MQVDTFFLLVVLILSVVLHEVTHGYVAEALGDPTARMAGRLTLNPLKHLDMFGSVILPGLMLLSQSPFLFGWAKPVPYNPYNLDARKWRLPASAGEALVAGSGPAVNILLALIFGLLVRFAHDFLSPAFISLATAVVVINTLLAVINLIPIPPLDGSKVLAAILPGSLSLSYDRLRGVMEQNLFGAFVVVLAALYLLAPVIGRLISFITGLIIGSVAF